MLATSHFNNEAMADKEVVSKQNVSSICVLGKVEKLLVLSKYVKSDVCSAHTHLFILLTAKSCHLV